MLDLFIKNTLLINYLEYYGLLWWFCQLLDSHPDGTHSLQMIYWWASDEMLTFLPICSDEKLINILERLRVSKVSASFRFCTIRKDQIRKQVYHSLKSERHFCQKHIVSICKAEDDNVKTNLMKVPRFARYWKVNQDDLCGAAANQLNLWIQHVRDHAG